jgi:hypothetical protein
MKTLVEKTQVTYKELMSKLNAMNHGDEVHIEYNTVRNFNLNDEVNNLSDSIRSMSVKDVYEGDNLNEMITDFFNHNIHGEKKDETYRIRKDSNGEVEMNDAAFILFDSDTTIKSVYVRNIISVVINGTRYTR